MAAGAAIAVFLAAAGENGVAAATGAYQPACLMTL